MRNRQLPSGYGPSARDLTAREAQLERGQGLDTHERRLQEARGYVRSWTVPGPDTRDPQTAARQRDLHASAAERRIAALRLTAAPAVEGPVEGAAAAAPGNERLRALIDARYRRSQVRAFWMSGTTEVNPAPGEDFVVEGLTRQPLAARWGAQAAPGGPMFYVAMWNGQFTGEEGEWAEFAPLAGEEPGFAVRRVRTPAPEFTGPLFQTSDNVARTRTEPSGGAASMEGVEALAGHRYGLGPAFPSFWMTGTGSSFDPAPGEDFEVEALTTAPVRARWDAPAAPGGPLFYVVMWNGQFTGAGGDWVEFARLADGTAGFAVRRVTAPPPEFTGPLFQTADNIARPYTEPSGRAATMEGALALAEQRHGLGVEFLSFSMHGTRNIDPVPGEDFFVDELMREPVPASWDAQPAPGGPSFYVAMERDPFGGAEGHWVEFAPAAGDEPGFAVRRVRTPPPGFTGPRFQTTSNIVRPHYYYSGDIDEPE